MLGVASAARVNFRHRSLHHIVLIRTDLAFAFLKPMGPGRGWYRPERTFLLLSILPNDLQELAKRAT